jgi:hypothetical protein
VTGRALALAAWAHLTAAGAHAPAPSGGPARRAPDLTPPAAPAAARWGGPRTFVVQRVNGRGLPFQDRFATTPGYEHRVHLERFLVRLEPGGRFTFAVWGAYKDAPRGEPAAGPTAGAGQVRDAVVRGRWTLAGTTVTLTPEPSKRGKRYAPAVGRLTPAGLVLRYEIGWEYAGGQWGTRRYELAAAYDPSYL